MYNPQPRVGKAFRRVIGTAIYLAAVVVCFELVARLALSSDAMSARVRSLNADVAWRQRWLERQESRPKLYYSFDVHHETRGWAVAPGVTGLRAWGGVVVNTSSRGLRGVREFSYQKPLGTTRIVVLGDSFTFGDEVGDEQTWSHQLSLLLPGVEVLNLGVHGYGHDQMLLYLQEEGVKYRPDIVLLGFLSDDMERNVLGFRDYAKPRFDLDAGKLKLRNVPIPSPEQTLRREFWRSKLLDVFSVIQTSYRWRSGRTPAFTRELTVALLDEIAKTARGIGAVPAFAYLPVYAEIDKPDMSMTYREQFFFDYCRDRGIQSMYLRHFFLPKVRAGVEFKTTGHWGPLEHATAAEGVAAYLLEKGLVDGLPAAD